MEFNLKIMIEKIAKKQFDNVGYDFDNTSLREAYVKGAVYATSLYNGISPDTVKEMLEALKVMIGRFDHAGNRHPSSVEACREANEVINKAEQELNTK